MRKEAAVYAYYGDTGAPPAVASIHVELYGVNMTGSLVAPSNDCRSYQDVMAYNV